MHRRCISTSLCLVFLILGMGGLLDAAPAFAVSRASSARAADSRGPAFASQHAGSVVPEHVSTKTVPQVQLSTKEQFNVPNHLYGPVDVSHRASVAIPNSGAVRVAPVTQQVAKPQTVFYNSFRGLGENGSQPSDSTADIGYYNVVEAVNTSWAVYDRSGGQQYSTTFQNWFGTQAFDPVVIFDPWGGRFFILVDTGSSIKISVARQSNALGNYCTYTFNIPNFPDYPRFGVDINGIYFTANVYQSGDPGAPFLYPTLYQVDRTQMENCGSVNFWQWDHMRDPNNNLVFTLVPAIKYNYFASDNGEYLVDHILGGGCSLTLWKIYNHILYRANVNTQCYTTPPDAVQKGSNGLIAASANGKTLYQATYRDGLLDVAMGSGYDWGGGKIRSIVDWFKINPISNSVVQQGRFGHPDYWFFFPAIQQEANGQAVFVWNASGSAIYPSIWYTGLNTDGSLQGAFSLASGTSYYGTSGAARWGDYQSARLDPSNLSHVWICGQYASATDTWGTYIGNVAAS